MLTRLVAACHEAHRPQFPCFQLGGEISPCGDAESRD